MALFDYGNTRLRARLANLQAMDKLESLAELGSIDSLLSALTKTPYRASIETALTFAHGYTCLSQALRMELANIARDVNAFYSDFEGKLVGMIFLSDDLLNLKTIVRGQLHDIPPAEFEDHFLASGSIPMPFLKELARAKTLDDAIDRMVVFGLAVAQPLVALRGQKDTLTAAEVNLALEQWYYRQVKAGIKGRDENSALLRRFFDIQADIANLNTLLRRVTAPEEFGTEGIARYLVEPGAFSRALLEELSEAETVEQATRPLFATPYREPLKRALAAYAQTSRLSVFEREMRVYLLGWLAGLPRQYPLGIGVPLGYYGRKRIEIRNLRFIGKGILSGIEPRAIKASLLRAA